MMQFQIALFDSENNTGIQFLMSVAKKAFSFQRYDKCVMDRFRIRGIQLSFFYIWMAFQEIYIDPTDIEVRDTEEVIFNQS